MFFFLQFESESILRTVAPDEMISTDSRGDGASPSDPVEISLVSTVGGEVIVNEQTISSTPPAGEKFIGQQISITVPDSTPDSPIIITFVLDASLIPDGMDEESVTIYRNGTPTGECIGLTVADPDPCVSARVRLVDGDLEFTVLTSKASDWNFSVPEASSDGDAGGIDGGVEDIVLQVGALMLGGRVPVDLLIQASVEHLMPALKI